MVAPAQKISSFSNKVAKEQALFQTIRKVKEGKITLDEIEHALTGNWRDIACNLQFGLAEQGVEGYEKVYITLMVDNPHLRKWRGELLDAPKYAGTLLSEVKPEKVEWLWKPRLALGKVTMLDGDPGLGKSLFTADLAARISRGLPMPDGAPGIKGGVVLIAPEDGLADTIQPRLARAGADLTKISSLGTVMEYKADKDGEVQSSPRGFCLATDIPLLEKEIERVQAKLIIVDPIMAVIGGGKNIYKDNEVRDALMPLKSVAEKHHAACIMVRHLTKVRGDNPLMAGMGSIAFGGLARTVLMVIADPLNEGQSVLCHIKSNIGRVANDSLNYIITSDEAEGDERPYVVWGGTTDMNVSEMLITPRKNEGGNRQEILDLLKEKAPEALEVKDIAEALPEVKMSNLKVTLMRMYDKGEIGKSARGLYHAK